jgi:hypothetical protein
VGCATGATAQRQTATRFVQTPYPRGCRLKSDFSKLSRLELYRFSAPAGREGGRETLTVKIFNESPRGKPHGILSVVLIGTEARSGAEVYNIVWFNTKPL